MATVFEVRDELCKVVKPLIPPVSVPERQGRRPAPDRVCFNAIVSTRSEQVLSEQRRARRWRTRGRRHLGA